MQKILFLTVFLFAFYFCEAQQTDPDAIIGYYHNVDPFTKESSQVYIYKNNQGKYEGKVCWVENLEKKKFLNHVFLKDLEFMPNSNDWQNGIAKYPGKNGTYKMDMRFVSPEKLRVRGYWGISLLGKTLYWVKEDQQRIQK